MITLVTGYAASMPARKGSSADGALEWVPEHPSLSSLRELGEQPGDKEDLAGKPFVGPAGRLLDRALDEAGVDPDVTYRTNVVKHFRFSGTRGKQRIHKSPSHLHVAACGPWLLAELDVVQPVGVVVLGGTAGKALYGSSFRVGDTRGRLQDWPEVIGDVPVGEKRPDWALPTTHPSAVLRSRNRDEDYERFVHDLQVAAEALG
jgi:uracil-DNA glycosylase family 4